MPLQLFYIDKGKNGNNIRCKIKKINFSRSCNGFKKVFLYDEVNDVYCAESSVEIYDLGVSVFQAKLTVNYHTGLIGVSSGSHEYLNESNDRKKLAKKVIRDLKNLAKTPLDEKHWRLQ